MPVTDHGEACGSFCKAGPMLPEAESRQGHYLCRHIYTSIHIIYIYTDIHIHMYVCIYYIYV